MGRDTLIGVIIVAATVIVIAIIVRNASNANALIGALGKGAVNTVGALEGQ